MFICASLFGLEHLSKRHLIPGSLLYILGTALVAFSRNIAMLLCGRFILGASVGMIQPGMELRQQSQNGRSSQLPRLTSSSSLRHRDAGN